MENNLILKIREFFVRNILILLLLPLLTFLLIFISYGNELQQYLSNNQENYSLYELLTIQKVISQLDIPNHIIGIASDIVNYSYVLFSIWLILFAYSCYYHLSRKEHNFTLIFIELAILLLVYFFIIRPGLSMLIQTVVWVVFLLIVMMIALYGLFFKRMKHEKK